MLGLQLTRKLACQIVAANALLVYAPNVPPEDRVTDVYAECIAGATSMKHLASQAARQHTAREGPQVAAKGRLCLDMVPQRRHIQAVFVDDSARAIRDTNHCAGGRPDIRQ